MNNNVQNQFSPLTMQEKSIASASYKQGRHDEGTPITPVPDSIAQNIPSHPKGTAAKIWHYRDAREKLLFSVCRFIEKDGRKEDRPLTYRQYEDGSRRWAWKGLDRPRPLYGLDRLAKAPDANVVVCEGEKSTDAAQALFPDLVAITSPNGAGSPHCADWTPLQGRVVTVWPDNDDEGWKYAEAVARLVKKAGANAVRVVNVPETFPHKWDLADPLPEGFAADDLNRFYNEATPITDPLENLIERSIQDPGEPFTPEVLSALHALKKEDRPAYERLRARLKKAGIGITSIEEEIEKHADEAGETATEPDHLALAQQVIDHIGADNILSTIAHVWLWKDIGVWKPLPDRPLKQITQQIIADSGEGVYRHLVDGVTEVMKSESFRDAHAWNKNHNVINFKNGELHWAGTGWELKPHVRENYLTTQIPHAYNPSAPSPRFIRFLKEIFNGDADSQQKEQALLEMMGYSLTTNTAFERFALLVGNGANGKSVVMGTLEHMLGTENICAVQPSEFGNKFQRAHMHGKLANLVTEIAEGAVIADDKLKAIVSGEITTAEHKNQPPFDFSPFCTCWFGTNHMPHTRDFSDALFRRALVVPFNNTFKAGVNADPHLKSTLRGEVEGIIVLALNAYGQALHRGSMTEPESCLVAKNEWRMEADQVAQFVEEVCIKTPQWNTSSKDLYDAYIQWSQEVGIRQRLGRKSFTQRLIRMGFEASKGTAGARMITGIELKPSTKRF